MTEMLETIMLICFGISWPINLVMLSANLLVYFRNCQLDRAAEKD